MADQTTSSFPSWLSEDFIQKVLRSGLEDPTLTLKSCEVNYALKAGEGFLSDMYRVIAMLQDSKEHRLIVKCHPQGGQREKMASQLDAFRKEIRMFSETLPAMFKLLQEAKPGKFHPFSAKCFYHGDSPVNYVIMEDLRQQGYVIIDRTRGMDLLHCNLALKTMAQFHAASIALHDRDPAAVEFYEYPMNENTREVAQFYDSSVQSLANAVSKWPGYEKYVGKLRKLQGRVHERLIKIYHTHPDELKVLNHGDLWTCNMMFRYSDNKPEDVKFLDFQVSNFGSPAPDLLFFLFTCPKDEVRINHWDSLLEDYHNTFTETLKVLGYSDCKITLETLKESIKDRLFYGFIIAASDMAVALSNPDDTLDLEAALTESAEGEDSNAKLYSNELYVAAMKRLLPLFDQEGLLD